jgi:uncharacterized membrane protein
MCKIDKPDLLWLKAILYRIVRIIIVFISGYFILDDATVAVSIAGVDMVAATLFYYYFDKFWCVIESYLHKIYLKWKYRRLG